MFLVSKTRINWKETEKRMREAGFTDEEIKKFKEKPVEEAIRFLDKEKAVPVSFKGYSFIWPIPLPLFSHSMDFSFKTKPYKPLFPIPPIFKRG